MPVNEVRSRVPKCAHRQAHAVLAVFPALQRLAGPVRQLGLVRRIRRFHPLRQVLEDEADGFELGGGDALCRADLDAYGWKRGKQS